MYAIKHYGSDVDTYIDKHPYAFKKRPAQVRCLPRLRAMLRTHQSSCSCVSRLSGYACDEHSAREPPLVLWGMFSHSSPIQPHSWSVFRAAG
jgi:hypothetical protein